MVGKSDGHVVWWDQVVALLQTVHDGHDHRQHLHPVHIAAHPLLLPDQRGRRD